MNRDFLEAYNKELALLYERSREFAEDFPGIAERLGGLTQDNLDPAVAGLLEGAAFMAARVQLKLNSEFETFTAQLLDQLRAVAFHGIAGPDGHCLAPQCLTRTFSPAINRK